MGSLEKRIREAMAKRAADPAVRAAEVAVIEAQINQAKAEKERAQQYKIATKQEAARRAAWDAKLKDLLKLVGAREQLAAIRKVWGAGRIDRKPEQAFDVAAMMSCTSKEIPDTMDSAFAGLVAEMMKFSQQMQKERELDLPYGSLDPYPQGMALALRCRFRDAEEAVLKERNFYGQSIEGVCWARRELALYTVVGFRGAGLPVVASLYRSQRLNEGYPGSVYCGGYQRDGHSKVPSSYCISRSNLETIFPDNPAKSRGILEEQLFKISQEADGFLEFKRQAEKRVVEAWHLPGQIQNSVSPHWYKRLPAVITVPIVRWW